jgi:hypothetical protein
VIEIGKVSGLNNRVRSAGTVRKGEAPSAPARLRPTENAGAPSQVKLPVEQAVREMARGVAYYIASNRLTLDEGYQDYSAEFVSEIPFARFSATPLGPSFAVQAGIDSPDIVRGDLKELLGGKPAELRIRYDAALIVSKIAVLIELVNGLMRVDEEQNRGSSRSRQEPSFNLNPSLRQVLAAALGLVINGNKTFNNLASIGVLAGRDGLLTLDSTLLKHALEAHGNEAVVILKSMADSFYDHAGLYVDPRILPRPGELLERGAADKADRSGKESERRWKKDKEQLEKRYLELGLILEESGKLRDWFTDAVESLGRGLDDNEPLDDVAGRAVPAVDLTWEREELLTIDRREELQEDLVALFIADTSRALREEDAGVSIKLLLKRRIISDKLLTERPDLEPKEAMVCLANEELLVERMEAERKKLFKHLDELSRGRAAARGYRPQFPFPPPMAAFITTDG